MSLRSSPILLVAGAVIVVIFAIVITAVIQSQSQHASSFSQVITVGPVWTTDAWTCVSSADYTVHGALRGLAGSQIAITITGLGSQSLYTPVPGEMMSFTVGSPAGHFLTVTRNGTVTGWITMQTLSDAKANCTQS